MLADGIVQDTFAGEAGEGEGGEEERLEATYTATSTGTFTAQIESLPFLRARARARARARVVIVVNLLKAWKVTLVGIECVSSGKSYNTNILNAAVRQYLPCYYVGKSNRKSIY